ncbi:MULTISPECIES: hypothetical protein [unclassified Streptomyces]|uniref:hypothetical protein n=1 Tax=unclassified Streptomyces TaxID=2593676 RepID=UPI00226EB65B|nr:MULTISPECIES: hypothetical protein [unclassified Streptomyces]MCY0922559.1 hypothetical protein [Streptomyces sp. H27-G5]MCY0963553.1 hypothetical protein [Streptomyces sp. H27-H5]
MKRIARGLTLACMTAALLAPVTGTASAAPQAQAQAQGSHDDQREDCNCRDTYNGYHHGGFNNGYYGGGIGLGP